MTYSSDVARSTIHAFIISLPKDTHRRAHLERQLRKTDIPFSVIEAVNGAALPAGELAVAYDRRKAVRLFNRELSKGEIGCALSHLAVYRKMVAEDIPCALILEDDASILDPDLGATLAGLTQMYPADTPVVVLLNHVRRYDAHGETRLDGRHCLYDAYRGVCAHGYVITKAAAEMLVNDLYPVHVVADKWEYVQRRLFPVKALVPYAIGLSPASLSSSIEAMGARAKKVANGRSHLYYIRKYLDQLRFLLRSRPFIRIAHQDKSQFDFQ
jgi:glycosyl transferase family 25